MRQPTNTCATNLAVGLALERSRSGMGSVMIWIVIDDVTGVTFGPQAWVANVTAKENMRLR